MDEALFAHVILQSEARKKEGAQYPLQRYLYSTLRTAPEKYFVGVAGLRGIGKTVLLLQLASQTPDSLYFSADAAYLRSENIYDLVRFATRKGYTRFFVDEIHYKQDWQQDLKTLYDEEHVRIVFSGSAAIEIKKGADLSRRALLYSLKPLSFREYLVFKRGADPLPAVSPSELFDAKRRKVHLLKSGQFNDYLHEYFQLGGLLYPSSDLPSFYKALENAVEKIIHSDLEALREINLKIENDVYAILRWIALSPAGETNYSALASQTSLSKPALIRVVDNLVKIGLVKRILPCGKAMVRKEPKLYLAFPFREFLNTLHSRKSDVGALREEFFVNHVENVCYLKGKRGEKTPDFVFHEKKVEVGGEGKSFYQNPDFIIKDSMSFEPNTIPLYLTGFLY